jgi:hypothetical protein
MRSGKPSRVQPRALSGLCGIRRGHRSCSTTQPASSPVGLGQKPDKWQLQTLLDLWLHQRAACQVSAQLHVKAASSWVTLFIHWRLRVSGRPARPSETQTWMVFRGSSFGHAPSCELQALCFLAVSSSWPSSLLLPAHVRHMGID